MEFGWTTFILEIVNFLALVWILKRFLYRPVLDAIARRKAVIDRSMEDARARQSAAETLERQFQNRLADWENEKEKLRAGVADEIAVRRAQSLDALEQTLNREREKARSLEERRLEGLRSSAEAAGIAAGVRFTARLLERLAGPELETKIIAAALEDLRKLPADQANSLRAACRETGRQIRVSSAVAIDAAGRDAIERELRRLTEGGVNVNFVEDGRLRAGVRISIGPWVLRANLADELEFFAQGVSREAPR